MVFAMKGRGARGGLDCHIPILKNDFIYVGFNCKKKWGKKMSGNYGGVGSDA